MKQPKSFLPVISPQNLSNPLKFQGAILCCCLPKWVESSLVVIYIKGVKCARTTSTKARSLSPEQEVIYPMMTLERWMEYLRSVAK
ncbi:hypothetical protein CJ030_MR1G023384 [Morella rubra]|uniref:Uncharacterized protein n=1 Tax=Morella rubra TaxID=262757 RepID=A0A6A1WPM1_9ROSI|nr:hypothetical protein CJ030_MR1G023384 [Morella rubra]